jgi:hypothetical protein
MAFRDANRTRKAYSYYRPRPRIEMVTSAAETQALLNQISQLASLTTVTMVWNETLTGATDDSNVAFELQYVPIADAEILLFINGVLQHRNNGSNKDFSISGKVVTMNFAPHTGDEVTATYAYDPTDQP